MCIAILNKKGLITDAHLKNSWYNNYHGAGFAYSQGERIFIYKNDKSVSKFIKTYKQHRKSNPNAIFLIHFRISTHGSIDKTNLHPFVINDTIALIHNGMIDLDGHCRTDKRSDTRFLCEEILSHLPDGWHLSKGVHTMLEQLGGWSKFAMIDINNQYAIVNEKEGHWDESGDNWYSNTSYESYSDYLNYGGKMVKRDRFSSTSSSFTTSTSSSFTNGGYDITMRELKLIEAEAFDCGLINADKSIYSVWANNEQRKTLGKLLNYYPENSSAVESELVKINTWYSLPGSQQFKGALAVVRLDNKNYTILRLSYGAITGHNSYYAINGSPFDLHMAGEMIRTLADTTGGNTNFEARINNFIKEPIASLAFEHINKIVEPDGFNDDAVECEWCSSIVESSDTSNLHGYTVCKDCNYETIEQDIYTSRSSGFTI